MEIKSRKVIIDLTKDDDDDLTILPNKKVDEKLNGNSLDSDLAKKIQLAEDLNFARSVSREENKEYEHKHQKRPKLHLNDDAHSMDEQIARSLHEEINGNPEHDRNRNQSNRQPNNRQLREDEDYARYLQSLQFPSREMIVDMLIASRNVNNVNTNQIVNRNNRQRNRNRNRRNNNQNLADAFDAFDGLDDIDDLDDIDGDFNDNYEELLELDKNNVKVVLTKENLKNIPTFKYDSEKMNLDDKQYYFINLLPQNPSSLLPGSYSRCSICQMEYEDGDEIRKINCFHNFHKSCIDYWLTTQKKICPICQTVVESEQ